MTDQPGYVDPTDGEEIEVEWINPHCRACGWVFPVDQEFCPMCDTARHPEYEEEL